MPAKVSEQRMSGSVALKPQMASAGDKGGVLDGDERAELLRLRRENSELRLERDFLADAAGLMFAAQTSAPPSPQKITLLTAQGHLHDMWDPNDYVVRVARAQDPNVFYWQPIGNWNAFSLPLGPPCDAGVAEGKRLLSEVHPVGLVALCGYSQGAIITSRLFQWMRQDPNLKGRFIGGVTFGNPMREQGSYVCNTDPGGHGIASERLVNTPKDIWHDYVDQGDLYANVSGRWGEYCTAVYDLVMRLDPRRLMIEIPKIIRDAPPEIQAIITAIVKGIMFGPGSTPQTAAHIEYEKRECPGTGMTYLDHGIQFMRELGKRHAALASSA